jgi:8-amino-7-oxononanoate synthase
MRSINQELLALKDAELWRRVRPLISSDGITIDRDGKKFLNFSSNDYLGLAFHEELQNSFIEGVRKYGNGATASRLVCGTNLPHQEFEEALAESKRTQAALMFSSGYATAMGVIPALLGKSDFIIVDKLSHACLIDAARLSQATIRVFPHNNIVKLEKILSGIREKNSDARIIIATESVFSMDGDLCPLAEIVTLKQKYDALLLLDEAHGFGVLGDRGMGLAQLLNLQEHVDLQMGTLSKSAGLSGGFVACSREIADLFINRARSFIYSTAPPPALAFAAIQSLQLIRSSEGKSLREKLASNISGFTNLLSLRKSSSAIMPIILGENSLALLASSQLEQNGIIVPAIRYPTVPRNSARLRVSLSASHSSESIVQLIQALQKIIS